MTKPGSLCTRGLTTKGISWYISCPVWSTVVDSLYLTPDLKVKPRCQMSTHDAECQPVTLEGTSQTFSGTRSRNLRTADCLIILKWMIHRPYGRQHGTDIRGLLQMRNPNSGDPTIASRCSVLKETNGRVSKTETQPGGIWPRIGCFLHFAMICVQYPVENAFEF